MVKKGLNLAPFGAPTPAGLFHALALRPGETYGCNMTLQLQAVTLIDRRRATSGYNLVWETAEMTDEERAAQEAAIQELDALSEAFKASEQAYEQSRQALRAAIIDNLMTRTLRPSQVEAHTPYDRVHIGRIAREAGVPPLRAPRRKSAS
ncbi:hypothetical protein [Streptomyces sp. NPDC096030]|uniref:hypothetical protein n=1 Tax=Streptomyces sp. NPDC096030 TaxID=3155423 RepID=UPI0033218277